MIAGGLALAPFGGGVLGAQGVRGLQNAYSGYPHVKSDTGNADIYLPTQRRGRMLFPGTELAEKQSSAAEYASSNITDIVIKMALELQHYPQAHHKKVASIILTGETIDFEEAVQKIGSIICA
jgi:hypothetical protein